LLAFCFDILVLPANLYNAIEQQLVSPSTNLLPSNFVMNCCKSIFAAVAFCVLTCGAAFAGTPQNDKTPLPASPDVLVRQVVNNELKQSLDSGALYSFKQRTEKPKGTTTKQMVETPDGVIGRIVLKDGEPLTPDEQKKEDERINRLLDPSQMRDKRKEQKEDEERTRTMVRAMPDAFIYKYQGTETGKNGQELVRMHFTPNPKFNPPSRETLVFQGMEGDMWVDPHAMRMAKIDGTMTRDVTIGWGILGRLDKGGRFIVEQGEVAKGHWDTTKLALDFTGKALIFKSIRIKSTDTFSDFRPVPRMTVAQALDYLRKGDVQAAADARTGAK
jgi:hypothetical protein